MSAAPLRLIRGGQNEGAPRPRLELVTTPGSSRMVLILLVIAAIGVFGVVGIGAMTAEASVERRELEADVHSLKKRYELLTAEVAQLESPERIRRVAVSQIGMVEPEEREFLVVDSNGRFVLHDPVRDGPIDSGFTDRVKQVLATQP